MQINWLWLVVGLIPYSIQRYHIREMQVLSLRALFWRLTIRWRRGTRSWDLSIPLITHLKQ